MYKYQGYQRWTGRVGGTGSSKNFDPSNIPLGYFVTTIMWLPTSSASAWIHIFIYRNKLRLLALTTIRSLPATFQFRCPVCATTSKGWFTGQLACWITRCDAQRQTLRHQT